MAGPSEKRRRFWKALRGLLRLRPGNAGSMRPNARPRAASSLLANIKKKAQAAPIVAFSIAESETSRSPMADPGGATGQQEQRISEAPQGTSLNGMSSIFSSESLFAWSTRN